MNISLAAPQNQDNANWGNWSAPQPQVSAPVPNISNTTNLFGGMSISQPPVQPQPVSSFNIFDGMTQAPVSSVQNTQFGSFTQPKKQEDDLFGAFQDSSSAVAPKPAAPAKPSNDAWDLGKGLFDLKNLKKDSEKKDKLAIGLHKDHHEKNLLHTKDEDLSKVWNSGSSYGSSSSYSTGFGGQTGFAITPPTSFPTSGYTSTYTTGFAGGSQGYGAGTSGFPGASAPAFGGFGQTSQPTGGAFYSGFPSVPPQSTFPSSTASSGFPAATSGWPGQYSGSTSTSGFPQTNQQSFF